MRNGLLDRWWAVHFTLTAHLEQQSVFLGKGCGVGTSAAQQSDGSILLMASVNGFAAVLGHYTGEFRITVPNDGSPIVVQAGLQNHAEATLRLTITLMSGPESGNSESNGPQEYQGTFIITGGTSRFGTATGGGNTLVMVMQQGRSFSFRLDGMLAFSRSNRSLPVVGMNRPRPLVGVKSS
jgi:hypothetical protein